MGNSSAKEQRPPLPPLRSSRLRRSSSPSLSSPTSTAPENVPQIIYQARHGRGSRSELSTLLGIGGSIDRDQNGSEARKETKQERDARRIERERVAREKERERSMREESVDGGYLVTQGVYTGIEDYNKAIVRHLMVRGF